MELSLSGEKKKKVFYEQTEISPNSNHVIYHSFSFDNADVYNE